MGLEDDLGDGLPQHPFERRSLDRLLPHPPPGRLGGQQREVDADRASLLGQVHLGKAGFTDSLHPVHARPPPRLVVRILDQLPDLLRRGSDHAAAARSRHGCS